MRRFLEGLVAHGIPSAAASVLRRGQRLILAYHNIVPDGEPVEGERTLHLPLSRFREQLDVLERSHSVVSLEHLVDPPRRSRRPLVAITFDDAYRGCVTLGLPELERRGMPCTVFVAPGLLGGRACWWDRLASRETGTLDVSQRLHLMQTLRGDADAVVDWAHEHHLVVNELSAAYGIATERELADAARLRGVHFGAHSWSHRNLAELDGAELDRELGPALDWLRARHMNVLPWLAFPYGMHTEETVARAGAAGYAGVVRISGGWVTDAAISANNLPRLNIPAGLSTARFMIKTRGIVRL